MERGVRMRGWEEEGRKEVGEKDRKCWAAKEEEGERRK